MAVLVRKSKRERILPYLQSIAIPLKTIWDDPLGRPGAIIFSLIILMAIFAPLLATHDPNVMNERTEGLAASVGNGEWGNVSQVSDYPINGMTWINDHEAFAVGAAGSIVHYQNGNWQPVASPVEENLYSVAAVNTNSVLAVGDEGIIVYFDGSTWTELDSPVSNNLYSISAAGPELALLVGQNGTVLKWDGSSLSELNSGVTQTLRSVSIDPDGNGVIVGDRGTILHYADGEFGRPSYRGMLDSTFRNLNDVHLHDGIGYAVGERGTIMGYDGERWFSMTSPESRELRGVSVISEDQAYAVGIRGIVLELVDGRWQNLRLDYRRDFRGISINDNGQGLAFGSDPYINELAPPSKDHFFGTTHLGRDIWSQVMYGSRTALMVGLIAAIVVNVLGVTVGLISGYYGGKVDTLLMRIVDIMYGLPLEPFAIMLVLIAGPSLWIIILAIGLLTWRTNARIIRAQVLSIVERPFIKAARVAGASNMRIMGVHIAPNILPLAFLQLAVAIGHAITAEATLSFLGLGPPQVHSWGTILHAARLSGAWRTAWWWVLPPGLFICITVVSVFLISRSLEVLTNPRLRGGNNRAPGSS